MISLVLLFILTSTAYSYVEELVICSMGIANCASFAKTTDFESYNLPKGSTFNSFVDENGVGKITRIVISNPNNDPNLEERLDIITDYFFEYNSLTIDVITIGGSPTTFYLNCNDNLVDVIYLTNTRLDYKSNDVMFSTEVYIHDGLSFLCDNPTIKYIYYNFIHSLSFNLASGQISIQNGRVSIGDVNYFIPLNIDLFFINVKILNVQWNSNEALAILDVNIYDTFKRQKIRFNFTYDHSYSVRFNDYISKADNATRQTLSFFQRSGCEVIFLNEPKTVNLRIFALAQIWYGYNEYSTYENPILATEIELHFQNFNQAPTSGSLSFCFNSSDDFSNVIQKINQRLDENHPGVELTICSSITIPKTLVIRDLPKNYLKITFSGSAMSDTKFPVLIDIPLVQHQSIKALTAFFCSVDFMNEEDVVIEVFDNIMDSIISGKMVIKTVMASFDTAYQFKGIEIETMNLCENLFQGKYVNLTYLQNGFRIQSDCSSDLNDFTLSTAEFKVKKFLFKWTISQNVSVTLKLDSLKITNLSVTNFSITQSPIYTNAQIDCIMNFRLDAESFRKNILGKNTTFELNGPPDSYTFAVSTLIEDNLFFYDGAKKELYGKDGIITDLSSGETIITPVITSDDDDSQKDDDDKKAVDKTMIGVIAGCGAVFLLIVAIGLTIFFVMMSRKKVRVEQMSSKDAF